MKKKIVLSICLLIIIAIGLYLVCNKNNGIKDNNIPDIIVIRLMQYLIT